MRGRWNGGNYLIKGRISIALRITAERDCEWDDQEKAIEHTASEHFISAQQNEVFFRHPEHIKKILGLLRPNRTLSPGKVRVIS
jgi:hypothetical protein